MTKPDWKPPCTCDCGGDSRVVDSRPANDSIRRRRKCLACGRRWTTWEREATFRRPRSIPTD
jgi:transcriptional regulator NrdR family protein